MLIGLVLLVGTLSRSPGLHEAFHAALESHDEGSANHPNPADEPADKAECALCLFAHGGWLNDWLTLDLPLSVPVVGSYPQLPAIEPPFNFRFTPNLGRGPPVHG